MKIIYILLFLTTFTLKSNWQIYHASDFDERVGLLYGYNTYHLDKDDNFWVGINNGVENPYGVMKLIGESYEVFTSENTSIPNIGISCITQGPNGDMYFGTYEDNRTSTPNKKETSVIRFNGKNWELFNQHNSPMHPYTIWDILATGEDEFWVATVIGLFHYKEGTWKSYFEDENEYRRDIKRLAIDKNNKLYITNGLRELYSANLNNQNVKFNRIETPIEPRAGVINCNIDSLNNLWLSIYKREGTNWITYDSIGQLRATRDKKLYGQRHRVVYEFKEDSYWEKVLETPDSVLGGELSLNAVDSKGSFWFTSGNRLVKYNPEGASVKQNTNITLFPNPAQNRVTIKSEEPIKNLGLYSLNLSKITDYPAKHTTTQEIDISNLASGVYFIKVNNDFVKFVRE